MSVPAHHVEHGVSVFISSVGKRFRSEFFDEGFEFVEFAVASDEQELFCVFWSWGWEGCDCHRGIPCERCLEWWGWEIELVELIQGETSETID